MRLHQFYFVQQGQRFTNIYTRVHSSW